MKTNNLSRIFLLVLMLLLPLTAKADLVVVMNLDSGVYKLSKQDVINIYMGRYRKLPNNLFATPLDVYEDAPEKESFYRGLIDKTLPEINSYWALLKFSGKTSPPESLKNQLSILSRVARDRNAIGYVDRANLSDQVRVVYEVNE